MTADITIRNLEGIWTVRAGGAVLGETSNALGLSEGKMEEVVYFPREDIAMAFLEPSETRTTSADKGEAVHFSIIAKSGPITDAAWSYEAPQDAVAQIKGHIAFYPLEAVTIEEV